MTALPALINDVPADRWGTWCTHGHRIVEPDPNAPWLNEHTPKSRIVDPWPCTADGCIRAQFETDCANEEAKYERERWAEYRALTY
ncbi:hypothetical protein [Catenuloplanes japonicus]|uniref:hypothetical protein n=1 Tax=Catenuloplanes japonicus TaxID=33876 RepID=UPI0005240810|nr:hypothetical protein [Catenuloplanes japonicus]